LGYQRRVRGALEDAVALAGCLMSIGPYPIAIQVARSKDEFEVSNFQLKSELKALISRGKTYWKRFTSLLKETG
jgi:hypothetical protein